MRTPLLHCTPTCASVSGPLADANRPQHPHLLPLQHFLRQLRDLPLTAEQGLPVTQQVRAGPAAAR